MRDIEFAILEYETSYAAIETRIDELNALIGQVNPREDSTLKELCDRRYTLYSELSDIEYALFQLNDYVRARSAGEVKLFA